MIFGLEDYQGEVAHSMGQKYVEMGRCHQFDMLDSGCALIDGEIGRIERPRLLANGGRINSASGVEISRSALKSGVTLSRCHNQL